MTAHHQREAARRLADRLVDPQARVIDYLRVSVTDRCNYRCTYCMPDDGVDARRPRRHPRRSRRSPRWCAASSALGVRRVRLTGGEPTVRRDLLALVRLLRAIPGLDDIALSTNGHLLAELAAPLRAAGVDRLNISLDTLDAERFRAHHAPGRPGARAGRHRGGARGRLRVDQAQHRRDPGFNDDELGRICALGLAARPGAALHRADADGGGLAYVPGALLAAAEIRAARRGRLARRALVADDGGAARGAGPARYFRLGLGRRRRRRRRARAGSASSRR